MSHDAPVPPPYRPMPSTPPPLGPPPMGPPPGVVRRTPWWRRKLVLGTAGAVVVVAAAGGAYAAHWYVHTGPQPAEALPADTLAYAAIDLDPSGQQKIAAHSLVGKFPASDSEHVGSVGDAREWLADKILAHSSCSDLDYDHDIEPWLGSRAAVAGVDVPDHGLQPAIVLQSTDDAKADEGMKKLSDCGGSDFGGWDVHDGWIVWSPSQEVADAVVKERGDHSLADDGGFKDAVDAAGGTGIVTAYVSKAAIGELAPLIASEGDQEVPPEVLDQVEKSFPTMGLTVHAEGSAVRVETAAKVPGLKPAGSSGVADLFRSMPADSSAAAAFDLSSTKAATSSEDMRKSILDAFRAGMAEEGGPEGAQRAEDFYTSLLGAPLETVLEDLLDSTVAVVVGPTEAAVPESPEDLPLAAELVPGQESRDRVLDYYRKLDERFHIGRSVTASSDRLTFAFDSAGRDQLQSGGLTSSSRFTKVVRLSGHDVVAAMYVDLHSGLLRTAIHDGLEHEDSRWLDNLSHLGAVGMTDWATNGYTHAEVRVSVE